MAGLGVGTVQFLSYIVFAVENPYGGFRSEMGDFGRSWNGRGNPNLFCLNGSFVGVVLFTRHGD